MVMLVIFELHLQLPQQQRRRPRLSYERPRLQLLFSFFSSSAAFFRA
jgi:hypothetical protein